MKVRAKFANPDAFGFYGISRRRDGDEFELEDDSHFSERWMEVVEAPKRRGRPPKVEEAKDDADDVSGA